MGEFNAARIRLAADMADDSQKVKALIVRAEDSRLMVDMDSTRRAYTELFSLNNQLIGMLRYVMLCYVMLYYVMLCYVMLCYVMLCYVMLYYVMICYDMSCYVML